MRKQLAVYVKCTLSSGNYGRSVFKLGLNILNVCVLIAGGFQMTIRDGCLRCAVFIRLLL